MIILKLESGLGNQLFQYAFARYLQKEYHETLYIDTRKLKKGQYGLKFFELNNNVRFLNLFLQYCLSIYTKLLWLLLKKINKSAYTTKEGAIQLSEWGWYYSYYETLFNYVDFKKTNYPVKIVSGFYQSASFFENAKIEVLNDLKFKGVLINPNIIDLAREISSVESVCVHIRRGDYLSPNVSEIFHVCTEEYYQKGLDYVRSLFPNSVFYVFSNTSHDIQWIQTHYQFPEGVEYVNMNNTGIDDFYLMSLCRHFVISNSTFSWWAAYLSKNENKIVVAPRPWVKKDYEYEGIYCKGWKVIDV